MSLKPAIAIVDAYSSGALLAPAARERQHPCIMVQSTATIPPMYRPSFRAGDFDLIIGPRSSVAETCSELRRRNVAYVLAGSEMGVELADQISARMGLTTNGTRLSSARRNKSLMGDALHNRGVLTPETFSSSRLNEIQDWIRQRQKWPVVIKPVESSGTDGVRLCTRESEVAAAFEAIVNRTDVFGKPNESVLVQEYVRGPEYAVDTVSYDGRHGIAALWRYGKRTGGVTPFQTASLELLDYDKSLDDELSPHVFQALNALGIKYGPAHCEVIVSGRGPVIVEVGARLNGGNNPLLCRYCGGNSQVELTLDAYFEPERFLAELEQPYTLTKGAMRVFLMPHREGRLTSISGIEAIERLPSFHEMRLSAKPGKRLSRIAGWVILVHSDRQVIHRDLHQIRKLEADGLYQIESDH